MERKRPGVVVVMAILNLVFGVLGLIGGICGGGLIVLILGGFSAMAKEMDPQERAELTELISLFDQWSPLLLGQITLGLVLSVVLLVAGIGLLMMRPWGRWLSIFYAVAAIGLSVVGLVVTLTIVNPAVEKLQAEMMRREGRLEQHKGFAGVQRVTNIMSAVTGSLCSMVYAVVLLVVMLLPSVSAAFAPDAEERPDRDDTSWAQYGGLR
ncbi:MAG: hypothetical protein NZ700_13390 [Gemmataceae bacterium]|nr:hypothetical protein [Gemmataceae bacterium]MDW8265253.1 hypothetical protein [Gemmataceae bacterium]